MAGTRPGGAIASAWAVLHYLGVQGYRTRTRQLVEARQAIEKGIEALGLEVFGDPQLSLLAYGFPEPERAGGAPSIFAVWKGLHDRGWFTGVVQDPDGIHLMLSPAHVDVVDEYLSDLAAALAEARGGAGQGAGPARYA